MHAIVLLPVRPRPTRPAAAPALLVAPPANAARRLRRQGDAPAEMPLRVTYVGLTADEQARALASFPGARRCALAGA